jgi:hypothetical protein
MPYYFPGDSDLKESVAASGSRNFRFGSRVTQRLTNTDVDAQDGVFTAAQFAGGIVTHTSASGAGAVTTDTAANYIANTALGLSTTNDTVLCYYINDGNQTLTFTGAVGVTLSDAGQTVGDNEAAVILLRRTSATAVTMTIVGA